MAELVKYTVVLLLGALSFQGSLVSARRINITMLDNCQDLGDEKPVAYLKSDTVEYHLDGEGLCDQVHGKIEITEYDTDPLEMTLTLYKCEEANMATPCMKNPTEHVEMLDCHRLMNDDSGPWHMITSGMDKGQCGDYVGEIDMTFARLRLEHLVKYLDVYDSSFNTFRLKMYFKSTIHDSLRGCGELDFLLLAT